MTETDPFAGVPAPLRSSLEKRGFTHLTAVQAAVVAALKEGTDGGRNLRISSQTGSGKTVALGIALAQAVTAPGEAPVGPRALVITPTRELAAQVQAELAWLYEESEGVEVDVVTGGTDVRREKQRLRRRARVLVGTPGRLLDHMTSGALNVSGIREVVLDEADQMLDMGFKDELDAIVARMPADRRSHLLSATFPPEVERLARSFQSSALHLEGTALGKANADIEHVAYLVRPSQRYEAVVNLLLEGLGDRCLIFVRTRADTADLCARLAGDGFGALPFSGELPQAQRTRTLEAFRNGIIRVLVATDVAARGIDVPDIGMVIHADIAKDPDVYTHRSGRTGRAGKTGRSLVVVPINAQARMFRLFREARIDARWEAVPNPKKIRQGVTKTARRALYEQLASTELTESELTYAQNLLEKQPPANVVAMLLRMSEPALPREPFELVNAEPRAWNPEGARPANSAPRSRGPVSYVQFSMSWGSDEGATASRCMSHACRRSGITRHSVGAINVQEGSTIIEVDASVAREFEQRCRKPDARDPDVHIVRVGAHGSETRAAPGRVEPGEHADRRPPRREFTRPGNATPRVKRTPRPARTPAQSTTSS